MRRAMREWLVLIGGLALMLVWAGLMEAFFSQHHSPVLPYGFKVAVGAAELVLLATYLLLIGRRDSTAEEDANAASERK
jgi:hypothetical protein